MNNLTNKDKYSLKLASQMGIHSNNDEAFRSFARFGQFELVKYLIKNGADIHANNDEALRSSAQRGYFDIAEYLIKNGANVHAENEEALCNSANNEHFDIVKLLVEHGADVQYKDLFLNITYNGNNKKEGSRIDIITKYLLQKGANLKQYDEKSIVHILNNIAFRNTITETSSMIEYLLENSSLNKEQKKNILGKMWAERYINGNSILDKNLYNIPIEVEKFWQTQYRDSKYTLFRGISGSRVQLAKWMDNGVFYHKDYKIGDSIILNEKGITSWSKDKNIAKEFMERYGSYGLLFITKAVSKDVFADLSIEYNMDQKEVLLLPGTIKCTILAMTNNTDKNVYKLSDM